MCCDWRKGGLMLVRNKKGEEAGWDGEKIRSPHRSD